MYRLKLLHLVAARPIDEIVNNPRDLNKSMVFITPYLPVPKKFLDIIQAMYVSIGFDISDRQKAMQLMSLSALGIDEVIADMSDAEWRLVLSYVSKAGQDAFNEEKATQKEVVKHHPPSKEREVLDDGKTYDVSTGDWHTYEMADNIPAPYGDNIELTNPDLIKTLTFAIQKGIPVDTKEQALAAIRKLYNKVPLEVLQQSPGYKQLDSMSDDMYEAFSIQKLRNALGKGRGAAVSGGLIRLSIRHVAAEADNAFELMYVLTNDFGFDMQDYATAMKVLSFMPPDDKFAAYLKTIPESSWSGAVSKMMDHATPPPSVPDSEKLDPKLVNPPSGAIVDDGPQKTVGPTAPAEQRGDHVTPEGKKVAPSAKAKLKEDMANDYEVFQVNCMNLAPQDFYPLQHGEKCDLKVYDRDSTRGMPGFPVYGGLFIYAWAPIKQEAMVLGRSISEEAVYVVLFPERKLAKWPTNKWKTYDSKPGEYVLQISAHGQPKTGQMIQDQRGTQVNVGDYVQTDQGQPGMVTELTNDGKVVYQGDGGVKTMLDVNKQFEVIKQDNQNGAGGQQPTGVGGPDMTKQQ